MLRLTFFAALLQVLSLNAMAGWRVIESRDTMTDETIVAAVSELPSGHTFSLARRAGGAVWAILSLPSGKMEIFGQRPPQYRIDNLPATDLESTRRLERILSAQMLKIEPTTMAWQFYSGKGNANRGALRDLMDGKRLLIRYYKFPEGSAEIEFDLAGAKPAIARALGIAEDADQAAAEREHNSAKAFLDASRRCVAENRGKAAAYKRCMDESGVRSTTD